MSGVTERRPRTFLRRGSPAFWLMVMCALPTRGYQGTQSLHFGLEQPSCFAATAPADQLRASKLGRALSSRHRLRSWRTEPPPDDARFSYSDDCFGLVALSTGIAGKDAVFSLVFVALSALAALASATVLADRLSVRDERKFPAAVAGASLLVAPMVKQFLLGFSIAFSEQDGVPSWTPVLEVGVCTFSLLYGFVLARTPTRSDK